MRINTFCPVCGIPYRLRKDGTIRKHERLILAHSYGSRDHREPCPGSGQPSERR